MSNSDIISVAHKMSRTIPKPKPKVVKPAQSWRTLKPGQYIKNSLHFKHNNRDIPKGSLWFVKAVDSSGCDLATVHVNPVNFHWTLKDWKPKYFSRVRKPSQAKLTEVLVESLKEN